MAVSGVIYLGWLASDATKPFRNQRANKKKIKALEKESAV